MFCSTELTKQVLPRFFNPLMPGIRQSVGSKVRRPRKTLALPVFRPVVADLFLLLLLLLLLSLGLVGVAPRVRLFAPLPEPEVVLFCLWAARCCDPPEGGVRSTELPLFPEI